MSQREQKVIDLIRTTIRKAEPTAKIILYGSRARGDAKPKSDWDVLAIIDKKRIDMEERSDLEYAVWNGGLDIGEEINLFTYTKQQWESAPPTLFKYNVVKEGILL